PAAGALAAALAGEAASAHVPGPLAASTARAAALAAEGLLAAGAVPAGVVALTEGVIKTMLLNKLKAFAAVVLVLVVGAGLAGLARGTGPAGPGQARAGDTAAARA